MASISAHYVDTDTFIVSGSGDQTGVFHQDRRVQCYCGGDGFKYGTILSSSYSDPSNTINLTEDSDNLTTNLISVRYGIVGAAPSGSMPSHDHTDHTGEGGRLPIWTDEGEPTGFVNRTDSEISFDDGTRTFTISGASYDYYIAGEKITKTGATSAAIADTEGLHWFYFDSDGALQTTTTMTQAIFEGNALVAVVYWDATNNTAFYIGEERHGITMDSQTHYYLHNVFEAQWNQGLSLANFDVDGSGNDNSAAQFSCSDGSFFDEDILKTITNGDTQTLSPTGYFPVYYLDGASADWRKTTATAYPVKNAGRLAYNQYTGGAWQQTQVSNNNFVLCHIFAANDETEPVIAVQGQAEYGNVAAARAGATTEINSLVTGAMPFAEFTPLGTVIYQTSDGYTNPVKGRVRSTDEGDDYVDFRGTVITGSGASVTDHGNLAGLADDDHTQYSLVDGTRAFTGTVVGVDPTAAQHLATKTYTDSASANAYQQAQNVDITDHGGLTGLADDDHTQYMPTIAGRAFSQPVSGQTPTLDEHLATKAYADGLGGSFTSLSDTPTGYSGKGLQLLQVNVGETAVEFVPSGGLATESYTQEASANALTQANLYSDTASANAETQANAYTDTQITSVSAAADEGDNATLASAQTYAETASANAYTQAQTYSDAASANALVQSWVFDPTPDSDHGYSGEWATMTVDVNTVGIGGALHLDTDGNWVDADNSADTSVPCQALALESGTGSKKVLFRGFMRDDTWNWTTVGGPIYVGTSGALTQTRPSSTGDQVQIVGYATHADRMFFNPDYTIVEIA